MLPDKFHFDEATMSCTSLFFFFPSVAAFNFSGQRHNYHISINIVGNNRSRTLFTSCNPLVEWRRSRNSLYQFPSPTIKAIFATETAATLLIHCQQVQELQILMILGWEINSNGHVLAPQFLFGHALAMTGFLMVPQCKYHKLLTPKYIVAALSSSINRHKHHCRQKLSLGTFFESHGLVTM